MERCVIWIPMDGAFENRPQKRIGAESIKQMDALLIVAPGLAGLGLLVWCIQKCPWKSGHRFTRALPADKVARIAK